MSSKPNLLLLRPKATYVLEFHQLLVKYFLADCSFVVLSFLLMWQESMIDATPFWKTSATRCDIYLDCRQRLASAGTPSNWSTWWIMDGSDDADCLRHADVKAKMNGQLMDVMRDYQTEN